MQLWEVKNIVYDILKYWVLAIYLSRLKALRSQPESNLLILFNPVFSKFNLAQDP